MIRYPKDILSLIAHLKKLPGIGRKSAERFAFCLLQWEEEKLHEFASLLSGLKERLQTCLECGCLMDNMTCHFCSSDQRDSSLMCVIASPRDAYTIEETGNFKGLYHVLGTLLSPLEGKTPDHLTLPKLKSRIDTLHVSEVIMALDSTLEGDTTALFLKEQLQNTSCQVSRLALGLPVGSSLDFVGEGTLAQALCGRQPF